MELARDGQLIETAPYIITNPYILDFPGLAESHKLHESKLEQSIIENIQSFLLELSKGFCLCSPTETHLNRDQRALYRLGLL